MAVRHNTLVSLPTGLGKTLIAAVVMYNLQRWFPTGKAIFLAPTKPLVHQQVEPPPSPHPSPNPRVTTHPSRNHSSLA